jgi:hypothetical protein
MCETHFSTSQRLSVIQVSLTVLLTSLTEKKNVSSEQRVNVKNNVETWSPRLLGLNLYAKQSIL